jgi:hypothetical protein
LLADEVTEQRLFAATRQDAIGTKRTCRDGQLIVRFQGEADMGRHMVPIISAASDPEMG